MTSIQRNPFPLQAQAVRCVCPTTGEGFTTRFYRVQEAGGLTYLWVPCAHCDHHLRVAGETCYDPDLPQPHCFVAADVTWLEEAA
ncbi:MAG TPA: hypothetical protein VFT66_15785 [Roseiflexaceae bacterium]|nr:hypothetical protein [Roseiflexaceae bacterium]